MKKSDEVIVSLLRENSRMSLTQMSRITRIPVSTIFERLKHYDKNVVKKSTVLVDFSKFGYGARARVLMKARKDEVQKLKEHLMASSCLNELYKVNNGYDFMAEFIFKTMKETEEYVEKLRENFNLEKEQVVYLIDEIGKEEFMSKSSVIMM